MRSSLHPSKAGRTNPVGAAAAVILVENSSADDARNNKLQIGTKDGE